MTRCLNLARELYREATWRDRFNGNPFFWWWLSRWKAVGRAHVPRRHGRNFIYGSMDTP